MVERIYVIFLSTTLLICLLSCANNHNFLDIREKIVNETMPNYSKSDDFFIQYKYVIEGSDTIKIELMKLKNEIYINEYQKGVKVSYSENASITTRKTVKEWNSTFINTWTVLYYKIFYLHDKFINASFPENISLNNSKGFYELTPLSSDTKGINDLFSDKNDVQSQYIISKEDTLIRKYSNSYESIEITEYLNSNRYKIPKIIIYNKVNSKNVELIIVNKFSIETSVYIDKFKEILQLDSNSLPPR